MAMKLIILLAIVLVAVSVCSSVPDDQCIRLTSAFVYDKKAYLVSGDNFIEIDSKFNEVRSGKLATIFRGLEGWVDAALVFPVNNQLYFFQGNYHFEYSPTWRMTGSPTVNSDWNSFFVGGIDASGNVKEKSYFFKGCNYRTGEIGGQEAETSSLGMPCDIYAAWSHEDNLYIVKGDNYWLMNANEQVTGPRLLTELLTLKSATLCHETENPNVEMFKAEQEYEQRNGCVIIDAAVTWYDTVYIFNKDEYLSLDSEGREDYSGSIGEWEGLPANVDAGVVWSGDAESYFFRGPTFYKYYNDYSGYATHGPYGNDQWTPVFQQGVEAAGNLKGKSYFFKGCEVVRYDGPMQKVTAVLKNTDMNLPCHLDAAFSRGQVLYAIKRNQIWKCDDVRCSGPLPLTNEVTLTSWTVCAP